MSTNQASIPSVGINVKISMIRQNPNEKPENDMLKAEKLSQHTLIGVDG